MSKEEIMKISLEEFSRIQDWMLSLEDKESVTYQSMRKRYRDLKALLTSMGMNMEELDEIKG
ncbi:MAG: hypothetical protein HFH59_13050 [Lachnospiraceae bacterium]|nr:hypothetical protein [Lachnospiraceae bacterium]MCI9100501.1 hypothetical protein [Lachnospiraceae bacterium]MCI9358436.1 hypothetical protein [Lachnospiraceae bacterium]